MWAWFFDLTVSALSNMGSAAYFIICSSLELLLRLFIFGAGGVLFVIVVAHIVNHLDNKFQIELAKSTAVAMEMRRAQVAESYQIEKHLRKIRARIKGTRTQIRAKNKVALG